MPSVMHSNIAAQDISMTRLFIMNMFLRPTNISGNYLPIPSGSYIPLSSILSRQGRDGYYSNRHLFYELSDSLCIPALFSILKSAGLSLVRTQPILEKCIRFSHFLSLDGRGLRRGCLKIPGYTLTSQSEAAR
jgi:hypothetical protein